MKLFCFVLMGAFVSGIFELASSPVFHHGRPLRVEEFQPGEGNLVILVPVNVKVLNHAMNLICALRKLNLDKQVVFWAISKSVYSVLSGIIGSGARILATGFTTRGGMHHSSLAFRELTQAKLTLMYSFMEKGYNVLACDVDTVWFSDPRPFLTADITSQKEILTMNGDDWWENNCETFLNTGILFIRSKPSTMAVVKRWMLMSMNFRGKKNNDQDIVARWRDKYRQSYCDVNCTTDPCQPEGEETSRSLVRISLLSPILFPNSYVLILNETGWRSKLHEMGRTLPVIAHFNGYTFTRNKLKLMKKYGMFMAEDCPDTKQYILKNSRPD